MSEVDRVGAGRVVLIVGGGRGLGRTIARFCAGDGYRVVVSARSQSDLQETVDFVKAEAGAHAQIEQALCDVTSDEQVRSLVDRTEGDAGPVYGLVCTAGAYGAIGLFDELPFDEWARGLDLNVLGPARCIHAVAPRMKQRKAGRIMLFSGGGQAAMPRFSSYVSSKGAIWRLTETVGAELAPHGVFLNAIAPGPTNTSFLDEVLRLGPDVVGQEHYDRSRKQAAEGGMPPEKTGELVRYLLSDKATGLYGKILSANYDRYWEIADHEAVSKSDVYAMRRVVTPDGRTRHSA